MPRRPLAICATRLVGAAGWLLLVAAAPAAALVGTGEEHITSYDVVLTVNDDGTLDARETIDYDFGSSVGKHGIFRTFPVRVPYDDKHDRVYDVETSGSRVRPAHPPTWTSSESGGTATYRIGNPDRTVSGRERYVVTYTVDGALNAFPDHVELYWNAIGDGWGVPIDAATVRVATPAAPTQQACFAGPTGSSLPCGSITAAGTR